MNTLKHWRLSIDANLNYTESIFELIGNRSVLVNKFGLDFPLNNFNFFKSLYVYTRMFNLWTTLYITKTTIKRRFQYYRKHIDCY